MSDSKAAVRKLEAQARSLAAEHRAHWFEIDSRAAVDVSLWTPAGRRWLSSGCHVLAGYDATDAGDGWRDVIARLNEGTEICDTDECDACEEDLADQAGTGPHCDCDFCRANTTRGEETADV